jgi:hypothetical protein
MTPLSQLLQDLARGADCALRAALARGALVGAGLLIAASGAGFLVLAGYVGLRFLVGPGLAALILGLALLTTAAGVLVLAQTAGQADGPSPPAAPAPADTPQSGNPPRPADPATLAVFTAAFLLGRLLAARYDPSRHS